MTLVITAAIEKKNASKNYRRRSTNSLICSVRQGKPHGTERMFLTM